MRRIACLAALVLAATSLPALAQGGPGGGGPGGGGPGAAGTGGGGGGFLDGIRDMFGVNEGAKPGAYASPSALDLVPDARDVGAAPTTRGIRSFEPIALPQNVNRPAPALDLPQIQAFGPQLPPARSVIPLQERLSLAAKLTEDGEDVPNGLVWHLFGALPGPDGKLPLVAASREAKPSFDLPAGTYFLHVAFGRAGVTKRIEFAGLRKQETVVLNAGGLKLSALTDDDTPLADDKLFFDIFSDADAENDRKMVASRVRPNQIVRLVAGDYHIVSDYGSVNAVVKANVRVEAGKLSEATLQHHAAQLTLKLVREPGGEAIADTAWSITTASGDPIRESVGAYSTLILAEGDYVVLAKNRDKLYQKAFTVSGGADEEVEVLISDLATLDGPEGGSGD